MDQARAGLHPPREAGPGLLTAAARGLLRRSLEGLREGCLDLVEGGATHRFGDPASDLRARVVIRDPRAWSLGAWRGEVGLGEAYMRGFWEADDLVAVVRLAIRNMAAFEAGGPAAVLGRLLARFRHRRNANHRAGSRANIAAHYDLGNAFYGLFLDPTLAYSCALFEHPGQDLASAQVAKYEHICRKLDLKPSDHLLEIGTGWGGFAAHAARTRGCRITTTTLSAQQHAHAAEVFRQGGLGDRIDLRLQDYRDLEGRYDKVVSIEMFEAVGFAFYDTYFGALERLLAPGGVALIQTITMNERQWPAYLRGTDWIQQHIFPGAELASVSEVLKSLGRVTTLNLHHLEDIGMHYSRTLHLWRERFQANLDAVRALGYDDTFVRAWDYYLAYCEGAFRERHIGDVQVVLAKRDADRLAGEPWGRS